MKAYERLLNYVKVPTPSDERSGTHPSSACQRVLAEQLVKEMKKLGVSDVRIDEKCYVYGKIPATKGYESKTKLGFIAHMDTVSDFADHAVNPVVHENYDGKDLKLAAEVDASVSDFMTTARLYCSGLNFAYNPHRMILNKVTDCYLTRADGEWIEIQNDKLYHVVTDLYTGQMLGSVT